MEAERIIDLLGLEYPADIKATYNDLPTTISKLTVLQEHLHYLYTYGTQIGDDDMVEYSLFANLHVRYRIMQFVRPSWDESDHVYFRIYEQKLPLMKWRPDGENDTPVVDQMAVPNEVESSNNHNEAPVLSSVIETSDNQEPTNREVVVETRYQIRDVEATDVEVVFPIPVVEPVKVKILAPNYRFERAYLEYRTRIGTDLVIRIVNGGKIYCHRMTLRTMSEFNIFAVSHYGIPTRYDCCDAKYLASLFFNVTRRFCGYDDAGFYISAVKRLNARSLFSTALKRLSIKWLSSPPSL